MGFVKKENLYLVLTSGYAKEKDIIKIAEAAIKGGVDIIQLREKNSDNDQIIKIGRKLQVICRKNNVSFIVNDDPNIAKELDADGVHLGQEDVKQFSVEKTRKILGADKIIGLSTHSLEQFEEALGAGFDYLAYGPIFHTQTKNYHVGLSQVKQVIALSEKNNMPVVFIGGINLDNVGQLVELGALNIAAIRSIMQAGDVCLAAEKFKKKISKRVL